MSRLYYEKTNEKAENDLYHITTETAELIENEIARAKKKHPGTFNSKHEGYAVLLEEVDELWDEVKHDGSKARMKEEAVQIAAMAIRFINELT